MTEKHLRESLRRLPEAGAGEGFTRAVLARLAEETAGEEEPNTATGKRWLGGLSLQAPGAGLAAAAAVMVIAATLALTLTPALDRTGQTETVAASAPSLETEQDFEGTPSHPEPVSDLATLPAGPADASTDPETATGGETGAVTGAAAVRDAVPDPAPAAQPSAPEARSAPSTAAPGAARARALDPEERRRAVERLRQLRREQERLSNRLAALTEAPAPTLVLGGDESLELVLDLNADAGPVGGGAGYGARPAGYRPEPEHRRYFN